MAGKEIRIELSNQEAALVAADGRSPYVILLDGLLRDRGTLVVETDEGEIIAIEEEDVLAPEPMARDDLEKLSRAELDEVGESMGLEAASMANKGEVIDAILAHQNEPEPADVSAG